MEYREERDNNGIEGEGGKRQGMKEIGLGIKKKWDKDKRRGRKEGKKKKKIKKKHGKTRKRRNEE